MSAEDLERLHGPIDVLTFAASLSVIGAVGWYLTRMRGRLGGIAGTTAVVAVFVPGLAVTRAARFVVSNVPGTGEVYLVEVAAAAVMVTTAIAVWPMVPKPLALPTRREPMAANRRLVAEQEARLALVDGMRNLDEDLERRVAARTRELERERRRFEIALEGTNIAVAEQDRDLRYLWLYDPPANLGGVGVVGRLPEEVLPPDTAAAQAEVKKRVLASGRAERFEVPMSGPQGITWYEGRVEPLVECGAVVGVMTVSIDITRHEEHEREIRDMLRELTHRSKNLLAVVQGIARQSGAARGGGLRRSVQRAPAGPRSGPRDPGRGELARHRPAGAGRPRMRRRRPARRRRGRGTASRPHPVAGSRAELRTAPARTLRRCPTGGDEEPGPSRLDRNRRPLRLRMAARRHGDEALRRGLRTAVPRTPHAALGRRHRAVDGVAGGDRLPPGSPAECARRGLIASLMAGPGGG